MIAAPNPGVKYHPKPSVIPPGPPSPQAAKVPNLASSVIVRVMEKSGEVANHLDAVEGLMNRVVLGMTGLGIFTWDTNFNLHRDSRFMRNPILFGDILVASRCHQIVL